MLAAARRRMLIEELPAANDLRAVDDRKHSRDRSHLVARVRDDLRVLILIKPRRKIIKPILVPIYRLVVKINLAARVHPGQIVYVVSTKNVEMAWVAVFLNCDRGRSTNAVLIFEPRFGCR